MNNKLTVSLSPHIHTPLTTSSCMWNVLLALLPAYLVAMYVFGLDAFVVSAVSVATCVFTEWFITRFMLHRKPTIADGSAILTGVLLAFNLPSILPWWMVVIGGVVAIGIGKMSFGGLGQNIWNPALVGRVFLLISFPAAMTTWSEVGPGISIDGRSGATMLPYLNWATSRPQLSDADLLDVSIGFMNGSLGETASIALLLGLVYLLVRKIVTWHIPVSVLGSAALFSWIFGGNPILDIFAGGLILGACFMATDYVTSPMTPKGQLIYGALIGFITIVIRRFGAYPEGVSFAILLMNSFTPLINRYCRPTLFGGKERREADKLAAKADVSAERSVAK